MKKLSADKVRTTIVEIVKRDIVAHNWKCERLFSLKGVFTKYEKDRSGKVQGVKSNSDRSLVNELTLL